MNAPTPATQTTLADWLEVQFAGEEAEARRVLAVGSCEPAYRPARVLADVAARRAIVKWCSERIKVEVPRQLGGDVREERDFVDGDLAHPADSVVLRYLASAYSHPDYDERWRP